MTYGYIYKIPFPNGKCYIGLTARTIKERWDEHNKDAKAGDMRCLFASLRKYNMVDTFQMIVIDTAETEKELCEKEIAHIEIHNSHYKRGYGYNMTDGGEGVIGYSHTDETKEKLRTSTLKQFESTEARQKQSEALKNYFENNPEARQKNSESQKKYNKDNPEKGKKHSEVMKKHYESTEARQKNSEAKKNYYKNNPEARQKHSEVMKKHYESTEARQKQSEAQKKRFEDPEAIERLIEGQRKRRINNPGEGREVGEKLKNYYKNNPEARLQMSEAKKKYFKDNPEARRKPSNYKPFDVFEKNGTYIKSFNYQFEAREYLQKTYDIKTQIKIGEVLQGNRNSSHGFTFKYKELF